MMWLWALLFVLVGAALGYFLKSSPLVEEEIIVVEPPQDDRDGYQMVHDDYGTSDSEPEDEAPPGAGDRWTPISHVVGGDRK
jgi:hypothetical protein